jgi:hypothetical protein
MGDLGAAGEAGTRGGFQRANTLGEGVCCSVDCRSGRIRGCGLFDFGDQRGTYDRSIDETT